MNPDIYHYHGVGPSLVAWLPRLLRPRARVITTFHCIDRKHQKWGLLARIVLRIGEWASCRLPHRTIAVSRTLEEYCREVYETETSYIPNGVAAPARADTTLIKRFGLAPHRYIAMVSRLVRHKGAHHLIEAWNRLQVESPLKIDGIKLVIVGDSAFTDDYVAELKRRAAGDPSIVFTGYQSGAMLDALFANARFIVHPSESEGLPIAVLEAMSYGKTVLASDIPENMEVIASYGVPFRSGDAHDLKNKIGELVTAPGRLEELGAAGKEFVLTHYHWDDIALQVEKLYHGLRSDVVAHETVQA
ncbi:glycosyltransferase family 4 protein [Candidatus Uhrbacteria bacterium]|nr:glycosyltransferase family 4 protein [Candidatus Uhrbacteria bacterium]